MRRALLVILLSGAECGYPRLDPGTDTLSLR